MIYLILSLSVLAALGLWWAWRLDNGGSTTPEEICRPSYNFVVNDEEVARLKWELAMELLDEAMERAAKREVWRLVKSKISGGVKGLLGKLGVFAKRCAEVAGKVAVGIYRISADRLRALWLAFVEMRPKDHFADRRRSIVIKRITDRVEVEIQTTAKVRKNRKGRRRRPFEGVEPKFLSMRGSGTWKGMTPREHNQGKENRFAVERSRRGRDLTGERLGWHLAAQEGWM